MVWLYAKHIPGRESGTLITIYLLNKHKYAEPECSTERAASAYVNSKSPRPIARSVSSAHEIMHRVHVTFSPPAALESIDVPAAAAPMHRGHPSLGVKPRSNYRAARFLAHTHTHTRTMNADAAAGAAVRRPTYVSVRDVAADNAVDSACEYSAAVCESANAPLPSHLRGQSRLSGAN